MVSASLEFSMLCVDQVEEMEKYLNKERVEFQKEVENRNRRLSEMRACWEREKEVSAAVMTQKNELSRQLNQTSSELERRDVSLL